MKSSFPPKYEPNIVRISTLYCATLQGRNLYNFWFLFWEKRWLHKFILKFTELYHTEIRMIFFFCQKKGNAEIINLIDTFWLRPWHPFFTNFFCMFVFFRLEWESAILRGCSTFRRMEEDRLNQLRYLNPSEKF